MCPAEESCQVGLSVSEKWSRQLGYAVSTAAADGHVERAMNEYRPTERCHACA